MKRMLKRGFLIFVVTLAMFFLLANSLKTVSADESIKQDKSQQSSPISTDPSAKNPTITPSTNQSGLSNFLLTLSEYESRGNATVLARIRKEMMQQEILNQAIDHANPPETQAGSLETLDSYHSGHLMDIRGYSEYMYDNSNPPQLIGKLDNPWGVTGAVPNYDATYYEATGWYQKQNGQYVGGEALTWGDASEPYDGLAEFHITAKIGPLSGANPPWHNYVDVEVSETGNWDDWHPVYYVEVHSSNWVDYTIGSININFRYITVMSWCPYNWPVEKSSLYVDNVYYIEYYRQVALNVYSGEGGTTDPAGQQIYWQYEQPKVTAIPSPYYAFDHWEEDHVGIGSTNPIWILMDDDHSLEAVFHSTAYAYTLTVNAVCEGSGAPVYTYLSIDYSGWYNYYGYMSADLTRDWHIIEAYPYGLAIYNNQYHFCQFAFFVIDNQYCFENPTWIYLDQDKEVWAVYYEP